MGIPLYYKIYKDIQQKIVSGEYPPKSLIPREIDLKKFYGVSIAPVRQALAALASEGLIIRVSGKGTFVAESYKTHPWMIATGFLKCYEQHWDNLIPKTICVEKKSPTEEAAAFLEIPPNKDSVHILRLQSLMDSPVILLENYFSLKYNIEIFQNSGHFMSMKNLLESNFYKTVSQTKETIIVGMIPKGYAKYLKVPEETNLMIVIAVLKPCHQE